jgi:hypothetical protein
MNRTAVAALKLVEEQTILADGSVFKPLEVKNGSDVLKASLLMLFKHISDIHLTVVEVIAEKFNIPVEDLHKTITEDPRWKEMFVNPVLTDLTKTAYENSSPPASPKRKRGRPAMTPEQKAAAKAAREAAKKTAVVAAPVPKPKKKPIIILSDEEEIIFN